jgi:hypothetical protein
LGIGGAFATTVPAFGAGTGYAPTGAPPAAGGTSAGLPGTVISSTAIQPTGGTGSATIATCAVNVTVPPGVFTGTTQLVITDAASSTVNPTNGTAIVTFGVGFFVNGTKVTGSFPAVTVTVSCPSITGGSAADFVTATGLQNVPGALVHVGSVTFAITSDPVVEVVAVTVSSSAPATAIASGTSAPTGKPVVLEMGVAGVLILGGSGVLVILRPRHRGNRARSGVKI